MNPEDWCLCVGIGSYRQGSKLLPLPGAVNDAKAIYEWMCDADGGGIPKANRELFISTAGDSSSTANPTFSQVQDFLLNLYDIAGVNEAQTGKFRVGRRLWIYCSGHGMDFRAGVDGNGNSISETGLLTADAKLEFILPHVPGLAWARVFQVSQAFDEVVLLMDCCRTKAGGAPITPPPVKPRKFTTSGKMMAAFAVSEGRAAIEKETGENKARGEFTVAVEKLLRAPRLAPVDASTFLINLGKEYPAAQYDIPNHHQNFILLEASPPGLAPAMDPGTVSMVVHGETTGALAAELVQELNTVETEVAAASRPFQEVLGKEPAAPEFEDVQNLIVVRDMPKQELRDMIRVVKPATTVVYGQKDPGIKGVRFIRRDEPAAAVDSAQAAMEVGAALAESHGSLSITSDVSFVKLQLWGPAGVSGQESYGSMEQDDLPSGRYRVNASIGSWYERHEVEIKPGKRKRLRIGLLGKFEMTFQALPSGPLEVPGKKSGTANGADDQSPSASKSRSQCVHETDGTAAIFSVPPTDQWHAEACVAQTGKWSLESIRLVRPDHPAGGEHAADAIRTWLRLAMTAPLWPADPPPVKKLHRDPVSLLLAASLRLRNGEDPGEYLTEAAALLGWRDPDVQLLSGPAMLAEPPLLAFGWFLRLQRNQLAVVKDSPADGLAGNILAYSPWLAWAKESSKGGDWLRQVADAVWPGWNVAPELEIKQTGTENSQPKPLAAAGVIEDVAPLLGAPPASVRRRNYKSPPIDKLVQHERLAFPGASHDQLVPALAVAFMERGRRKWKRIDVLSLADDPLSTLLSNGRTGQDLLDARDAAEAILRKLLPIVTEEWVLWRYDGLYEDNVRLFASLWDWEEPGNGFVHSSLVKKGEDVRFAPFKNEEWNDAAKMPEERYTKTVEAYRSTKPVWIAGTTKAFDDR